MQAKFVYESIKDILRSKSEEDIMDSIIKKMEERNLSPNQLLIQSSNVGFLPGVKKALEMGANVHTLDDSPLRLASENGHTNVVEILLKNHADIHANNDWPLRWASASADNHLDVVKLLLKYGANAHAQDVMLQ